MSIHQNHIETIDNGDSYTFKFKFGSDRINLPAELSEKSFTVQKLETLLNVETENAAAEALAYEAAQIENAENLTE